MKLNSITIILPFRKILGIKLALFTINFIKNNIDEDLFSNMKHSLLIYGDHRSQTICIFIENEATNVYNLEVVIYIIKSSFLS